MTKQSNEHGMLALVIFFVGLSAMAAPMTGKSNDLSKEALLVELTGKDYKKIKEEDLYAEIISAYRSNNQISMKARSQTFIKRFSASHFADNVLYLQGQMALQNKSYAEALRFFQKVSRTYPNSNKAVSAQFSKALTYKKLNLVAEARRVLKEVMARYPGSPESFRASAELKLLN